LPPPEAAATPWEKCGVGDTTIANRPPLRPDEPAGGDSTVFTNADFNAFF